MTIISQPSVTVNKLSAQNEQSNSPQKVLFIGQQVTAGTATSGQLYTSIENGGQEDTLFGANSMIAGMIRSGKLYNQVTRFDAIPLDDAGAAVAATGTIAFGGAATAAGTIYISIGSDENHKYELSIAKDDTADDIGDALEVAVTADTDAPFSASNSSGTVTITADNKGTAGNFTTLKSEGSAAGVTVTLTAMASGATDPTLTDIFDVIGDERYQTIVFPAQYGYDFVTDLLDARFNTTNNILDGVGITCLTDALADLKVAANAENSQSLVIFGNKEIDDADHKGSALVEFDYNIAAQFAAVRALRLTEDANISDYVISTGGALDSFGGSHMASFPYFNTPLTNLPLTSIGKGFSQTEIEELLITGISVIGNNKVRSEVIVGEVVTTYKTDASGNADLTWKDLNYVDTGSGSTEYFFNNLKSDYAQSRITEGDLIAGRVLANEAKIRASMAKFYSSLAGVDYVLVESGPVALKYFKDNLTVTIDKSLGKVTVTMKTPIVTQLRTIIIGMQVTFSVS